MWLSGLSASLWTKNHWFNSQSGHMPGLQAKFPVGGVQEATTHWCFSPSSSFPSPLSKNKWIKYFKKEKHFIYIFLEGELRREKKRERNINVWLPLACPRLESWPATQACALTGNEWPFGSQTGAQSTEPHLPWLITFFNNACWFDSCHNTT